MKYEQMTLATLKAIIERAIINREGTADVELLSLDFDHDEEDTLVDEDNDHLCQSLSVFALVDEEETEYTLIWDTVDDEFIVVRNENEAAEWSVERDTLFVYTKEWNDVENVIEMFGLQEIPQKDVKDALDRFHKEWDAVDKNQDEEDLECQLNRVVCTCQLELRKMRRVLDTYEQTRCDVNRQFSWWLDGRATTDEVMAELGIIRERKGELEQVLNTFKKKITALDKAEGMESAEKQQKRWAIYDETRHEIGYN